MGWAPFEPLLQSLLWRSLVPTRAGLPPTLSAGLYARPGQQPIRARRESLGSFALLPSIVFAFYLAAWPHTVYPVPLLLADVQCAGLELGERLRLCIEFHG